MAWLKDSNTHLSDSRFRVPNGWIKGEPLEVRLRKISNRNMWSVSQSISCFYYDRPMQQDHVAFQWFDSWDDFATFIQWWNAN